MSALRLMIVDDKEEELATCRDTVERYKDERQRDVHMVECRSVEEAFAQLDNSFDGAIIDLKLSDQGDEGNQVVRKIEDLCFRIPVAILTGTPDAADRDFTYIGVYKKGEPGTGYADLLDNFWDIYNTGLTRIMGGRGIIENALNRVFKQNVIPRKDKWVEYGRIDPHRTEKALIRHTLGHLLQLIDEDEGRCFPEEVYLAPPITNTVRTGSIVKNESGRQVVILNPACDLVIRENGTFKTDHIMIVMIENEADILSKILEGITNKGKKEKMLKKVYGNNYTDYYHWLPQTEFFDGGFLNFRKIWTFTEERYKEAFSEPKIQISPAFIKDVVARFSSYYARQGQPDIDCSAFITNMTTG